jgi:phage-related protein
MLFNVINWLIPAIGSVIGFLAQWSGVIVPLAVAVGGFALLVKGVTLAMAAYEAIMMVVRAATVVWTGVQWLLNAALTANPIGLVILAIAALVAGIIWAWNNCETFRNIVIGVFNAVKNSIEVAINWVVDRISWLVNAFNTAKNVVGSVFNGIGDGIKNAFRSAFNFVANAWNNTVGRLSFSVPSWVPGIGGSNFSAPRIPTFHTGGIVPGAPGSEQLALLQAGERVTSRNKVNQEDGGALMFGSDGSKLGDAILALVEEAARKQGRRIQRA